MPFYVLNSEATVQAFYTCSLFRSFSPLFCFIRDSGPTLIDNVYHEND